MHYMQRQFHCDWQYRKIKLLGWAQGHKKKGFIHISLDPKLFLLGLYPEARKHELTLFFCFGNNMLSTGDDR